jgi:nitrogen-specific signal transduction histidine kinase
MGDLVASILDAVPFPILVVDDDVRIIGYNLAASRMISQAPGLVIRQRAGEVLHCLHSTESPGGCGRAESCKECLVRNSVNESARGGQVVRKRARMVVMSAEGRPQEIYLLVTTAPFAHGDKSLVLVILEDINELMELKSILPICAQCKKIRSDQEYWQSVEKYFKEHMDLDFSHGICPECAEEMYGDFLKDMEEHPLP